MRQIKSRGGITDGRLRNQESAHKVWIAMLDHFSEVSQIMDKVSNRGPKTVSVNHPDTQPAAVRKDLHSFTKARKWFTERVSFDQEPGTLISFSTGLSSRIGDHTADVNPDSANKVGEAMQKALDGMSFITPMQTKKKVKNLSCLRKPVKVSDTSIVIDSFKLFNRLILITERNGSVQDALKFELTVPFPLSLFDNKQCMRKPQKADLGIYL